MRSGINRRIDGHQGRKSVDYVLNNLLPEVARTVMDDPGDISISLKEKFQEIDTKYCSERAEYFRKIRHSKKFCSNPKDENGGEHNQEIGSGSALTLLCIYNNRLILAGLGDCGIVFSSKGKKKHSLRTHKPNDSDEEERIKVSGLSIASYR